MPVGEVTQGVPSLAELAQSDGETEQLYLQPRPPPKPVGAPSANIRDAVPPSLSALLEEDEADAGTPAGVAKGQGVHTQAMQTGAASAEKDLSQGEDTWHTYSRTGAVNSWVIVGI